MFITRIFFILLAFGSATSSLTLTARVSRSVPRQAEEQRREDTKESSSNADVKETGSKKKNRHRSGFGTAAGPAADLYGVGKGILARSGTNLDESRKASILGCAVVSATERNYSGPLRDRRGLQQTFVAQPYDD
jgi:hypothetical protein